ncbi:MAG: hypothetical protein CVT61_05430 [Actinobacteria bacterium HGW-Actinobacteria-11]|nr:MAG: hypothetical protein CVT61_05430 [Actinobacteria bacterium HGW-Actinobacteria-11]
MTPATLLTPALPTRLAILVAAVALLAGCTPDPEPTPTPTAAFASEEEAFAAAEATYRAYNDALNQVDPENPETFEATYFYTSGDFQASDKENFSNLHARGYSIQGAARVRSFFGTSFDQTLGYVDATVCVDVSGVDVIDADGQSVVNPERPDIYAIDTTFKVESARVLIDHAARTEDSACDVS